MGVGTAGKEPGLSDWNRAASLVTLAEPPAPAKGVGEARVGQRKLFDPREHRREVVLQEMLQHTVGHCRAGVFVIRTPPLGHQAPHGLGDALNKLAQLNGRLPPLSFIRRGQTGEVGYDSRFQVL